MVHLCFFAEGYSDALRKFEEDWHGKLYANGKAKLRVREVKLYTCSVNEIGRDECLADFKSLFGEFAGPGGGEGIPFKWGKLTGWLRRFGRLMGMKPIDDSKIVSSEWRGEIGEGKKNYNAHFVFLGEIPDQRVEQEGSWGKKSTEIV